MAEVSRARIEGDEPASERTGPDKSGQALEKVVRDLARDRLAEADRVLREIDETWSPPPFDPFLVAQALGIRCVPVADPWLDDAMICVQDGTPTILFRQQRSEVHTYFNIFHEIAHTLFPDYCHNDLYQRSRKPRLFQPEGQLEGLCDIAAAEFLMPMDLFCKDLATQGFGAARVESLCRRYGASVEAVCLRMVESNLENCALALLEPRHQRQRCQRRKPALRPDAADQTRKNLQVTYTLSVRSNFDGKMKMR